MTTRTPARARHDSAPRTGEDPAERGAARSVPRQRHLPSGRAVIGGLLVTVAGLGVFAAHQAGTAAPETPYLIAVRTVPAGRAITADDLGLAPMRLVEQTARRAISEPDEVIGRIALVGLNDGDLISAGSIGAGTLGASAPSRRVAIELDRAQALDSNVAVGDAVDVLMTPPPGNSDPTSKVIVRQALVENVSGADDTTVGSSGKVRLSVVVPDEAAAIRLVDAYSAGRIHLIAASTMSRPVDSSAAPDVTDDSDTAPGS